MQNRFCLFIGGNYRQYKAASHAIGCCLTRFETLGKPRGKARSGARHVRTMPAHRPMPPLWPDPRAGRDFRPLATHFAKRDNLL